MSFTSSATDQSNSALARTLIALLLLLPVCGVWSFLQLIPAYNTIQASYMDMSFIAAESEFVGMENYARLSEDRVLAESVGYTVALVIARIGAVMVAPPLVGLLAGAGNRTLRIITRIILSLVTVLIVPISLALLWRAMTNPLTDIGQSFSFFALNTPETARASVIYLDTLITGALALVVGATAFMSVSRGRSLKPGNTSAAIWVWVVGILLALASLPLSFQLPFILTEGGPANATSTFSLVFYRTSFQMMRFGYASALASLMIFGSAALAVIVWLVLFISRLRMRLAPPAENNTAAGVFGLLLGALFGLPLCGVIVLGMSAISGFPSRGGGLDVTADLTRSLFNTIMTPWMFIWGVQIPLTYLAGLALGFLRPVNRVVSELLFLVLLVVAFVPQQALVLQWFMGARQLELLNTQTLPGIATIVSAASLILFKLYFDGAREQLDTLRQSGDIKANFASVVFPGSLGVALLAGIIASMSSMMNLLIPLASGINPDTYTTPVFIMMIANQYASDFQIIGNLALTYILIVAGLFILPLLLLHFLLLDRLAIIAGKPLEPEAPYDEYSEFR